MQVVEGAHHWLNLSTKVLPGSNDEKYKGHRLSNTDPSVYPNMKALSKKQV